MDTAPGSNKKRRVNTCSNCRKRKVQCDQATPACGRCVKAGYEKSCLYHDDSASTLSRVVEDDTEAEFGVNRTPGTEAVQVYRPSSDLPDPALSTKLEDYVRYAKRLEAELASLKTELALQSRAEPQLAEHGDGHAVTANLTHEAQPGSRLLKGKSFKTRYYGASYPESIIACIPDLTSLSKQIIEANPVLARTRKAVRSLDKHNRVDRSHSKATRQDLEALLPPRPEADELIELYFDTFDNIYHIFHEPSFRNEYLQFRSPTGHCGAHFVALVLLVTAISRCVRLQQSASYVGKNTSARQEVLTVMDVVENWFTMQKQRDLSIKDFQIRLLICLAKAVISTKFKQSWIDAATALKSCVAVGMQIDPSALSSATSTLDKEMRRRIWSATMEFELQSAFVRGMPADPIGPEARSAPPGNVDDRNIAPETIDMPVSEPLSAFKNVSYLSFARRTYHTRYTVNQVLNARKLTSYDEVRNITREIHEHIHQIPQWTEYSRADAPKALLRINLLQCLLALHSHSLQQFASPEDRSSSMMVIVNSALDVLETHKTLLEKGNHVLQLLCHDHTRIALSICLVVDRVHAISNRVLSHSIDQYAEQITSGVVDLIAGKVECLGAGQQNLWLARIADVFVKAGRYPLQKAMFVEEAVSRTANGYYKIIASQKHEHTSAGALNDHAGLGVIGQSVEHVEQILGAGDMGLSEIDLDPMSSWYFDEWALQSQGF